MPATSTSFGTGSWGLSADETGLIIESISYDYSNSNKTIKNRTGNTVGITYYDEQCKVTLNGRLPATAPFSGTLATSIVLSNTIQNYYKGGVSGLILIEGITIDRNQEDYASITINTTQYPNITA